MKIATYNCGIELLLNMIGGKWKTLIMYYLINKRKRFSELKSLLPGITSKMLTKQLRELERDGLIKREIYHQVPLKVEYSLTAKGMELEEILLQMCEVGTRYLDHEDSCQKAVQLV